MKFMFHCFILIFTVFVLRIIWKLSDLLYNWFINLIVSFVKKRREHKALKNKPVVYNSPAVSKDFALQYSEIIKERMENDEREQAQ